jgi:hypothetical protein
MQPPQPLVDGTDLAAHRSADREARGVKNERFESRIGAVAMLRCALDPELELLDRPSAVGPSRLSLL